MRIRNNRKFQKRFNYKNSLFSSKLKSTSDEKLDALYDWVMNLDDNDAVDINVNYCDGDQPLSYDDLEDYIKSMKPIDAFKAGKTARNLDSNWFIFDGYGNIRGIDNYDEFVDRDDLYQYLSDNIDIAEQYGFEFEKDDEFEEGDE